MDRSGWRSMGKAFVLQWTAVDGDSFMMHAVPASPAFLGPSKVPGDQWSHDGCRVLGQAVAIFH